MGMTSDLRKCYQLHQNNKHVARKRANQRFHLSHLHLGCVDKNRPARSWIRDELIDFNYHSLEEDANDDDQENLKESWEQEEIQVYIKAQWKEIYDAVDLDNADLLDCLLPPINNFNGKEKYWLNKLYLQHCSGAEQILSHAISLGRTSCIRVLLYKIYSGDLDPATIHRHDYLRKTPLSYACERGDLNLVRELVKRAHVNINQGNALAAAVQQGHETVVDYLLSQGCDPHRGYDDSPLTVASYRGYLGIVNSLLKYGAGTDKSGDEIRAAFDGAIAERHIEIAKVLLYHKHGDLKTNWENFTPMMLAAHHDLRPIVDLLFQMLPLDRAVDDLLRLACRYTIDSYILNRDKAFYFFTQGLNRKKRLNNPILDEVYEFRHECETLDQLLSIRDDDNAMRMHALLVNERLFLQYVDIDVYSDLIGKQCHYYHNANLFHRCLQLNVHAYQLMLRFRNRNPCALVWRTNILDGIVYDLQSTLTQSGVVPVESLVIIFNWIFASNVSTVLSRGVNLLKIVIYMIQSKQTTPNEQRVLIGLVRQVMQRKFPKDNFLGFFIREIVQNTSAYQFGSQNLSTLSIIRLLIQHGADVNRICDREGSRPLHIIAKCSDIVNAKPVIELLLASGAHPDTIDYMSRLPEDIAQALDVKILLCQRRKLSLKCRCAQMIASSKMNYQNHLPASLVAFVQLHVNSKPNLNPPSTSHSYDNNLW